MEDRFAVRLADLSYKRLEGVVACTIAPIATRETVDMEPGKVDGVILLLSPGVMLERVQAIAQVFALRKAMVRFYRRGPKGGWKKLGVNA